jgi:hypothetical protein
MSVTIESEQVIVKSPAALAKLLRKASEDAAWNIDAGKRQRLELLAAAWSELVAVLPAPRRPKFFNDVEGVLAAHRGA